MNLYITADQIGIQSGGGAVTFHESEALKSLGPCEVWGREQLNPVHDDPWGWDYNANVKLMRSFWQEGEPSPSLAHFYAGTFSHSVERLREHDCKVVYTAAAHDVALSRREHERFGIDFAGTYPHLCEPELWRRYVQGYLDADVLVCPSRLSADVMRGHGAKQRIEVIPHGVDLPKCKRCLGEKTYATSGMKPGEVWSMYCNACNGTGLAPIAPLPPQFRVGYLGSYGADKGVVYLLQAWAKLNFNDAVLVLGGRDSQSPFVEELIRITGARNVVCTGWVKDVGDFYNQISFYVQPSVTEGFGIEVLEAMAHGRPVICSTGAGAADAMPCPGHWACGTVFPPADAHALAEHIHAARRWELDHLGQLNREHAEQYTWDKIRQRYVALWKELLGTPSAEAEMKVRHPDGIWSGHCGGSLR